MSIIDPKPILIKKQKNTKDALAASALLMLMVMIICSYLATNQYRRYFNSFKKDTCMRLESAEDWEDYPVWKILEVGKNAYRVCGTKAACAKDEWKELRFWEQDKYDTVFCDRQK